MATNLQKLKRLADQIEKPQSKSEKFVDSIKALAAVIDDQLVAQDLIKAFQKIVAFAKETRDNTRKELRTVIEYIKKENDGLRKDVQKELRGFVSKIDSRVQAKLATVRDGRDGIDADPEEIKRMVLDSIEIPEQKDFSPDLKLTKEQLENRIKELEDRIKRLSQRSGSGGGISAIGVAQAFKYIGHTEQPVGDIDGVNTTYTVKNNIFWIAGFMLNGEQIGELPNFTYAGKTITFSTALPADYSGRDFEIKYIGT